MTPIHNNKQNKVPLRDEGVDPEKVKLSDSVMWVAGDTYEAFTVSSWESLRGGNARL